MLPVQPDISGMEWGRKEKRQVIINSPWYKFWEHDKIAEEETGRAVPGKEHPVLMIEWKEEPQATAALITAPDKSIWRVSLEEVPQQVAPPDPVKERCLDCNGTGRIPGDDTKSCRKCLGFGLTWIE